MLYRLQIERDAASFANARPRHPRLGQAILGSSQRQRARASRTSQQANHGGKDQDHPNQSSGVTPSRTTCTPNVVPKSPSSRSLPRINFSRTTSEGIRNVPTTYIMGPKQVLRSGTVLYCHRDARVPLPREERTRPTGAEHRTAACVALPTSTPFPKSDCELPLSKGSPRVELLRRQGSSPSAPRSPSTAITGIRDPQPGPFLRAFPGI